MDGVEMMLMETDNDSEDSDFMDYLDDLRRNPLDLNKASIDQLQSIPHVTHTIALRIISYRIAGSHFSSKRELMKIDGISDHLYDLISPYLVARKVNSNLPRKSLHSKQKKNFLADFRSLFIQDLLPKNAFTNGKYSGSRLRNANRLKLAYNSDAFSVTSGIVTDNDPGEN